MTRVPAPIRVCAWTWRKSLPPRKYKLYGTHPPPMRLSCPQATFVETVDIVVRQLAVGDIGGPVLRPLDRFAALVPCIQSEASRYSAAQIVTALDPFLARLSKAEPARRRAVALAPPSEDLLPRWGYPNVMDEFRFHITLTDQLNKKPMIDTLRAAHAWFAPALGAAQALDALRIFGVDKTGRFHPVRLVPLRG